MPSEAKDQPWTQTQAHGPYQETPQEEEGMPRQ